MKILLDYIKDNCSKVDREESFRSSLNECYNFSRVGGPFAQKPALIRSDFLSAPAHRGRSKEASASPNTMKTLDIITASACALIGIAGAGVLISDAFGVLRSTAPSVITVTLTAGVAIGTLAAAASAVALLIPRK